MSYYNFIFWVVRQLVFLIYLSYTAKRCRSNIITLIKHSLIYPPPPYNIRCVGAFLFYYLPFYSSLPLVGWYFYLLTKVNYLEFTNNSLIFAPYINKNHL